MTTTSEFLRHLRTLAARQSSDLLSDQQLLERFLNERSETSFAELVQRHGPMVLSVCRRVLHHAQDAEDAFQATFLILARKAGSIRKPQSLSSWLHGVAHRSAEYLRTKNDRRTAHERRKAPLPPGDALEDITWRELRSVLDDELAKLPEKYRAPLVLCYLEARTQDEAARQLGWSKNTFGRRMNQARQMLARRLTRRGLTLPAALTAPLLIDGTATAALPPLLTANTVRAGLALASGKPMGGLASVSVVALAESGGQALLASKIKWALVLLAAVSVAAGGVLTYQTPPSRPAAREPAAPPAVPPDKPQQQAAIETKGETITVSGRAFDPDNKPFSGAKIYLIGSGDRPKKHPVRAVSASDGRFQFTFSKSEYFEAAWIRIRSDMWRWCDLVATAPGYGPARVWVADVKKELSLHLNKEARINGRVRDLEGRPVEGAEVRVIGTSWSSLLTGATTDKEGRFQLTGVGRGVEMELRVSAPTIETKWINVKTPTEGHATVEVLAGPTKPVEGIIRSRDTGKPLAGVEVRADPQNWMPFEEGPHILRTVTDEQGHYRLLGLPKAQRYELTAFPPVEQGCVITVKRTEDSEGLKPARLDFDLRRGVIVRFRLIDRETGHPMRGMVQYASLMDNPLWLEATRPDNASLPRCYFYFHGTDRDNYIQFVAYPGSGVIYGSPGMGSRAYLNARLDPEEEKNGHYPGKKGDHLNGFLEIVPGYRRIDAKPTDRQLVFDIMLDPGRTLRGTLVDPAGQPIRGVTAWGLNLDHTTRGTVRKGKQTLETAAFTATGIDRDKPCTLSFVHRGRKLIGQITVPPEDKGPLTVRLQPWGTLTGRLVDAAGKPLANMKLHLRYLASAGKGIRPPGVDFISDRAGRFRVEGLLPDQDHELIASPKNERMPAAKSLLPDQNPESIPSPGNAFQKLKARAGETKDLGDITMKVGSVEPSKK